MEIINGLHNLRPRHRGCVLTVGNFDGVHRGHSALIDALCDKAEAMGVPSMLMTFEPQPREFFAGTKLPARLTRFREKVHLLSQTRLDRLLCLPFNERTANIEAEWFAKDFIVDLADAKHVVIGDDFRFGRAEKATLHCLKNMGEFVRGQRYVDFVRQEDRISSTLIRHTLAAGDFAGATEMLGHEYFIMGRVVYGRQLGRQLNKPANTRLQRYRAALEGVYCVTVEGIGDTEHQGIANIGVRPPWMARSRCWRFIYSTTRATCMAA